MSYIKIQQNVCVIIHNIILSGSYVKKNVLVQPGLEHGSHSTGITDTHIRLFYHNLYSKACPSILQLLPPIYHSKISAKYLDPTFSDIDDETDGVRRVWLLL